MKRILWSRTTTWRFLRRAWIGNWSEPEHYQRYLGSEVEIRLYKGKDGTKNIQGVLQTMEGDSITVQDHDGKEWHLQLAEIAKAKLAVKFCYSEEDGI